ncbi:hypothetical protein AWC15_11805 [Mycobacterium lacus]|uniref:Uncharacterized protein n=1 Tax=Mycobacterium lacus TaxID=169765 RepID=A0A1X1YVM2_9MYCO|nr:hypothetical protein AWC15_11805 [Mycobacterium lacus]BBX94968.1 hypothetical protein MLAC_02620 [Mycobacterium lacus]
MPHCGSDALYRADLRHILLCAQRVVRASYRTGQTIHVDGGTHGAGGWYQDPRTGEYRLGPS